MRPISTSDSLAMLFHLPVHVTLLFPILVTGAPRPQISADGYVCTADKTGFTRVGFTFACPTGTMCDSSVTAGSPCVASGQ